VHNQIKLNNGIVLQKAVGENANSFYQVEKIPAPIISAKANIQQPELSNTFVYDIATAPGKIYTFTVQ
jgi:alpha-L-fucosidase 2